MGKQFHQDEMLERLSELLAFLLWNPAMGYGPGNSDIEQIKLVRPEKGCLACFPRSPQKGRLSLRQFQIQQSG
jgi:hypothetical protein